MVQFLSINFFSWISSIFVGFFKSSRFFVSLCTSWLALWILNTHNRMVLKKCKVQLRIWHMTLVTLIFWQVIIHQTVFFEYYRAIILNAQRHRSLPVMSLMLSLVYSILNASFLLWLSTIHFKCILLDIVFLFRCEAWLCNGMSCLFKVICQACLWFIPVLLIRVVVWCVLSDSVFLYETWSKIRET